MAGTTKYPTLCCRFPEKQWLKLLPSLRRDPTKLEKLRSLSLKRLLFLGVKINPRFLKLSKLSGHLFQAHRPPYHLKGKDPEDEAARPMKRRRIAIRRPPPAVEPLQTANYPENEVSVASVNFPHVIQVQCAPQGPLPLEPADVSVMARVSELAGKPWVRVEGPDMVNIGGYNLPKEFALLYEKIWQGHGHIAAGTLPPFLLAIVLPAAIEVLNIVGEMCGTWRGVVTAEILHDWGSKASRRV